MELTVDQVRVLGCLIEKAATTPDNYPLTSNSLVSACNQKSSRDPQMSLAERDIDAAMLGLRELGLARTLTGSGRTVKHRHVADEALRLSPPGLAILSVLMLRGPQTVGELRTRTERQHDFESLEHVDAALDALRERTDPLVVRLEREPGRKEQRWTHLLFDDEAEHGQASVFEPAPPPETPKPATPESSTEVAELRSEIESLQRKVDHLYRLLDETAPE